MSPISQNTSVTDIEIDTGTSGVAWGPILGGAFGIAGISLILIPVGAGLGFASISPWHPGGEGSKALSATAAIWLIISQWFSTGFGGYLTGRLRTKWAGAHTHEVFFRDTAHGFLTWALAAVFSTLLLIGIPSHIDHGKPMGHEGPGLEAYATDTLYRSSKGGEDISENERRQATDILIKATASKNGMSNEDHNYLSQNVAAHTGLSVEDADARINETVTKLKTELDEARKGASLLSFIIGLSMLMGAFIASAAAALGGRDRDNHYTTGRLNP